MTDVIEPQVAQFDIGDLLSSKRQQRRETRADVAKQTRLPEATIEKLEANQFKDIGPLVYVRGYLASYAKHLGLDSAYVMEQYSLQYPAEEITLRSSAATSLIDESRQQTKRHSKTVSFLTAGLVVGGLAYGYLQSEALLLKKINTPSDNSNITTVDSASNVSSVLDEVNAAENLANDVLSGDTINYPSALANDLELDLAISPAAIATEAQVASERPPEPVSNLPATISPAELVLDENPQASATAAPEAAVKKATARIRFAFRDECWVRLSDATGKTLIGKVYKKGQSLDVTAKRPIKLVLGAPKAVHSASIDGKPTNLGDYQVSKLRFAIPK